MFIQFSPVVFLLLISGSVSLVLALIGWRNRAIPISRPFTLLMAAEAAWIFLYALELMSPDIPTSLLINDIEYPALLTVPVAWLFILLYFTGRERYLTRKTVPLFFIVPAISYLLLLTNPYHHLYYTGFSTVMYDGYQFLVYNHGPFFWITIAYAYIIVLVSLILAAGRLFVPNELYRRQTILLLCASCIPAFCNLVYIFQLAPFPGYDLTPVAFLLTGLVFAVGLIRYQLFTALPVAYSLVFSTMKEGVIVTDRLYRVMDLNPAAEAITGSSSTAATGQRVTVILPQIPDGALDPITPLREKRVEIQVPMEGHERYYEILVTHMDENGSDRAGYLWLLRDITDRKQAELELASANKKITLLTSITRHDISNKLTVAGSYHLLARRLSTDPLMSEYMDREEKAIEAIREQIAFTKVYEEIGSAAPVWQDVDSLIVQSSRHVDLKQVHLAYNNAGFEIYANPMLEKVFYNLFDNAMKYAGPGISAIRVTSSRQGDDLILAVEDDGAGISPEDKSRLFERGFGKNTGLGLFLSREILSITGIRIQERGEPGKGARFELVVPKGKYRFRDTVS
ncbi:histidine kinase N-terminal 7TM domain-containing protein [Methanoregula sp.]|uniref:histidine kinase N-terminal 7TM domain-containing protein n=1 Tax=Methanoregula sp. TaxID=2052170 RepID=UPI003561885C